MCHDPHAAGNCLVWLMILGNKFQIYWNQSTSSYIFIHENEIENVLNMKAIYLCLNVLLPDTTIPHHWQGPIPLQWRHNGRDGVSDHQPHDCLLNRLFRRRSKKTSKFRVTGFCAGNSPGAGEFPAQMASNAENVSIWWRHHAKFELGCLPKHTWKPSYVQALNLSLHICSSNGKYFTLISHWLL